MADGKYKINDSVVMPAVKLLKKSDAMQHFPQHWQTCVVHGVITAKGSGRKWVVTWDFGDPKLVSEHGAGALDPERGLNIGVVGGQVGAVGGAALAADANVDGQSSESESGTGSDMELESDAAGSEAGGPPGIPDATNPLRVDDLCWIEETDGVTTDERASKFPQPFGGRIIWPRELRHDGLSKKSKLNYFLLNFPKPITDFCTWTSQKMPNNPLTKYKFIKFMGIFIAVSLASQRSRRDCWGVEDDGLFAPLEFGRRSG